MLLQEVCDEARVEHRARRLRLRLMGNRWWLK